MSCIIACPKCKGAGELIDKTLALGTFGIAYLLGVATETCPRCGGSGHIKISE